MKIRLFLLAFAALTLTACDDKPQTVTINKKYSVDLPSFLSVATDLNEDASLQYENQLREFYVVVIDEPRKAFDDMMESGEIGYGPDLDGYSQLLVDDVRETIADKSTAKPTKAKINGLDARLASLSGTVENLNVYWKVGYIQGKKDYYQVLCWTLAENKEKYDAQMGEIINSFKETDKSRK